MQTKNFIGQDGFVWWIGVIENRIDPLNLGRCQVRIFGWHTEDDTLVPSQDLPWAIPMLPVNSSQVTTFKDGDMVVGFFTDGTSAQQPVIMGVFPGIPTQLSSAQKGFADRRQGAKLNNSPRKVKSRTYKKDGTGIVIVNDTPTRYPDSLNEPTTSRLARNENLTKTYLKDRVANLDSGVKIAGDKGTWNEPAPAYNAKFPYNKAVETESGHSFEVDDTPGFERINTTHRSGTFSEIYPSGTKVEKITKSNYQIIMSDDNVHIMGKCNITIDSEARILVKGNAYLDVEQNLQARVSKNFNLSVGESFNVLAKRINIQTLQDMQTSVGTSSILSAGTTLSVSSKSSMNISSGTNYNLLAGTSIRGNAPMIDLNPGSVLSTAVSAVSGLSSVGALSSVTSGINSSLSSSLSSVTSSFNSSVQNVLGQTSTGIQSALGISAGGTLSDVTSLTSVTPSLGGLSLQPATSALASTVSSNIPQIGGLVLGGASTGIPTLSVSDLGKTIGSVVGVSLGGVSLDSSSILKTITAGSTSLNNLTGNVIDSKLLQNVTKTVTDGLGGSLVPSNVISQLPALVTNTPQLGGLVLAGATTSSNGLSLGSILSVDKVTSLAKDAAKTILGTTSSDTISSLTKIISDSIGTKTEATQPSVTDILTGGGIGSSISRTITQDTDIASSLLKKTIGSFISSDDIVIPSITPELSKYVSTGESGFKLNDTVSGLLNDFFKKVEINKIVDSNLIKYIPSTVGDILKSTQNNPSVLIGSLVKSNALGTVSSMMSETSNSFNTLVQEVDKLPDSTQVSDFVSDIFDNSTLATTFGLKSLTSSEQFNTAFVSQESTSDSSGIASVVGLIDNGITLTNEAIRQNFEDMTNSIKVISSVSSPNIKDEIKTIINYHKTQNDNLIASLEESIRINTNQIYNSVVFVVDTSV